MRLYEYEAKKIFSENGMAVPEGGLAGNAREAREIAANTGLPAVIKSQVLVGGRGKEGGILTAKSLDEVQRRASHLLNLEIKGLKAARVLVERKIEVTREIYCGIAIDRALGLPVLVLSSEGGVDIEETAKSNPEKLVRFSLSMLEDLSPFELINPLKKIGLSGSVMLRVRDTVQRLYRVFRRFYALVAEVNPLVIDTKADVYCVDAVLELDDSSLYRNPEFFERRMGELSQREQRLVKRGSTFVPLGGNIGLICSGAGLGMATMDLIRDYPSLSPANFLETGGGITEDLMVDCMEIVLQQPELKAVFINIYGGINPIHEGAKGIARVLRGRPVKIPIVAKALGNRQEETWDILKKAGVHIVKEPSTQTAVEYLADLLGVGKR
jgi:succinyl-CoA synthetase beta subunit